MSLVAALLFALAPSPLAVEDPIKVSPCPAWIQFKSKADFADGHGVALVSKVAYQEDKEANAWRLVITGAEGEQFDLCLVYPRGAKPLAGKYIWVVPAVQ